MERLTREELFMGAASYNCRGHEKDCDLNCPKEDQCGWLKEALEKLKQYEDLEEQGKLLKLPCAVGDRIYRIDTDEKIENRKVEIYDIDNIAILSDGTILLKYDAYDGVICELENIVAGSMYLDFYRCFLTQEEADDALKKMEEGK
ncbi:MAG: hypothetical protein HDQ97_05940 [Lachnospiraceae bacterium]|nr:hypothetical protein [Lachnospiraceae bacterium]